MRLLARFQVSLNLVSFEKVWTRAKKRNEGEGEGRNWLVGVLLSKCP